MAENGIYAVITGDIVDSSKAKKEQHTQLLDTLRNGFETVQSLVSGSTKPTFDIFRGDSFQGMIPDPALALKASLIIRATLRKARSGSSSQGRDARTAIGIGVIDYLPEQVSEGDGEAYRLSGPYLDDMKTDERLSVITPWQKVNDELEAESALLDAIIAKWTSQQAEIVLELLQDRSRKTIGKAFGISQAAVHYRVKGAGWYAIEKFLQRFQTLIQCGTGR